PIARSLASSPRPGAGMLSRCSIATCRSPIAEASPFRGPMRREGNRRAAGVVAIVAALVAPVASAEEVNRIVLRVNGEIATLHDWIARRESRIEQITQAEGVPIAERRQLIAEAGRAAMKEIFEELLVLSRARQLR